MHGNYVDDYEVAIRLQSAYILLALAFFAIVETFVRLIESATHRYGDVLFLMATNLGGGKKIKKPKKPQPTSQFRYDNFEDAMQQVW